MQFSVANGASTYADVMTLNGAGNVGVGTSSPVSLLTASKSTNSGSGSTFPRLSVANTLATQGDGASTFNFADVNVSSGDGAVNMFLATTYAAGTWAPSGQLNVATNHPLIVKTNNTEQMRLTEAGVLQLTQGQIKFPATQVASADVNTLDDYEEGTFTPSIAFGGASVGITYFDRQGNYTKIGRQVTCTMYIALTAVGSSTGNAQITGLPFTCANLNRGTVGAPSFRFSNITFSGQLTGSVPNNGTNIDLSNTSLLGTQTLLTNANFNSASEFNAITVTYFTA
jgi:hypothetical protein